MKTIRQEIEELEAHNEFVQRHLLDRYKDDLPGLAKHIYGHCSGGAPESAKQSLLKNIRICEEKIANLEAQVSE
jgi:hypothetical protein